MLDVNNRGKWVYRDFLYDLCNFSVNLKLFFKTNAFFNGYGVSVFQNEKILEFYCTTVSVNRLNTTNLIHLKRW